MKPMLATRGDVVPRGRDWVHEVKWDGIRALVEVVGGQLRITSRSERDITVGVPELAGLASLGRDMVLDGEIVALSSGIPRFSAIAHRGHVTSPRVAAQLAADDPATLIIFDLLSLDGVDQMSTPLSSRRVLLEGLDLNGPAWQVSPTYADGATLLEAAEAQGLEGIVSKRSSSKYFPDRRSTDWLKFPIRKSETYVVGGYRFETGSAARLGSVLIGEPNSDGLTYRGRVGAGLGGKAGALLQNLLQPLVTGDSPFVDRLARSETEGVVWVRPEVAVEVAFLSVTEDGRLRHPSYLGVRADR